MVDNHRDGVTCPKHKKQRAHNLFIRFGRKFFKRTTDYDLACRILNGVRFEFDEGTYDPEDYKQSNPNGLDNQIDKYLEHKGKKVRQSTLSRSYRPLAKRITACFGSLNVVKAIGYPEIEEFLDAQENIGDKTRHEVCTFLHAFFTWLFKHKRIQHVPEMPETPFVMGLRKIVNKETQAEILEEIRRQNVQNPRVYIGVLWLCTSKSCAPRIFSQSLSALSISSADMS